MSETDPEAAEPGTPAVSLVRSLLERHAIPRHRHASYVGEFFRLSRAAAHQRVTRSSAWTLEEVQALAQHFGESLSEVVSSPPASGGSVPASMRVGALRLQCEVWLQGDAGAECRDALVALHDQEGAWRVVPWTAVMPGECPRRIARLEIRPVASPSMRVAVFDTDAAAGNTLCTQLRASGFDAHACSSLEDALRADSLEAVDAWVIDWPSAAQASEAGGGLQRLRSERPGLALILLSGGTRTGVCNPAGVAEAATSLRAQLIEKPVQLPFLVAALLNGAPPA